MTKQDDNVSWPMGIGFGVFFWFIFQPEVEDFVLNLPWIIKFIVFAAGGLTAFAGSIVFPLFLYETLRKIGISEGIAGWLLGLGFLLVYATVMEF
ncbi:hypothetical protein OAR92_01650 [Porticoccaceae bacterium]|nr:hypothetical protein [Porticoccaceae bacterium]